VDERRDEIAASLTRVRERVSTACDAVGRSPDEVTLIVVTKFFPASDVRILAELGVGDVGENRHQEASEKRRDSADLSLRWHFIGRLQSNKAAAVAGWADVVHSVDRPRLLPGLSRGAHERAAVLDVLIQVSLDQEDSGRSAGRSGVAAYDAVGLALEVAGADGLRLSGVMGVAPLGGDPVPAFRRLVSVRDDIRSAVPTATWVSAGMSGDLEEAVKAGATHVRVGSAVLGNRPAPR
jgi:pyridoxal phosphate enzyme (YggS family)